MAAVAAWLCCTSLFVGLFVFVSADQKNITAEAGQNVALTCRAPNNNINIVEWSRADLRTKNVLVYRNGRFLPNEQHPSFKDRVDLRDRHMKDGDVSLILKDVTADDTGRYECRVLMEESSSLELISIIYLSVAPPPPGPTGGTTEDEEEEDGRKGVGRREDGGNDVGLSIAAVVVLLVAAIVGFVIYRRRTRQQSDASPQPPPPVELQLLEHV